MRSFRWCTRRLTVGLAVAAVLAACGPTAKGGDDNQNNGTGGNDAAVVVDDGAVTLDDGGQVDLDGSVPADANCGAQTEEIELISLGDPPDMLIVLDRSGSMMLAPGFPPIGASKWDIMKTSLGIVLPARDANIQFGLSVFPTDEDCGVDPGARVPIQLNNASAILAWLNGSGPGGNTPAHFGLQEALIYYQSIPVNPAGQYVLFATDGIPNCGGNPPNVDITTDVETVQAVQDLANAGIHTFVLGFGGLLGLDPQVLNDAAQAGLEPKPGGPPHFYHADDAQGLQTALDTIAGGIIVPSCSYELTSLPPVPDDVAVYFDGVAVPRSPSHADGWDYYPDGSTITFFGSYCDSLMTGTVSAVSFIFGCPGPVVY
ncbi:MAG: hypothetical protein ABI333_18640 [bacterium]